MPNTSYLPRPMTDCKNYFEIQIYSSKGYHFRWNKIWLNFFTIKRFLPQCVMCTIVLNAYCLHTKLKEKRMGPFQLTIFFSKSLQFSFRNHLKFQSWLFQDSSLQFNKIILMPFISQMRGWQNPWFQRAYIVDHPFYLSIVYQSINTIRDFSEK